MGNVVAIGMMKDEADVAEGVVRHLDNEGVDVIIVSDNLSTDGTKEILEGLVGRLDHARLLVLEDPEVGYYQASKMTALSHYAAREHNAEWIIPFDADEIWYSTHDRLAYDLKDLPDSIFVAKAYIHNHFATALDLVDEPDPFRAMVWRHPEVGRLPKVAFRYREDVSVDQGNHSVHYDKPVNNDLYQRADSYTCASDQFNLRHFPYRSVEHFLRKAENGARAYKHTDLPEEEGAHWRQYGEILERHGRHALINEVWAKWFFFTAPVNAGHIKDPAPYRRWPSP